jgi:hypothetical protein
MSAVELSDTSIILACFYKSPDSDFYEFLRKLELLITNICSKGKHLILRGDLNVNFLQCSGKLQELQNLLLMNYLKNIVKSQNRITSHTKSLIDVIIVNNKNYEMFTEILDLSFSDHLAQFLYIKSKIFTKGSKKTFYRS